MDFEKITDKTKGIKGEITQLQMERVLLINKFFNLSKKKEYPFGYPFNMYTEFIS